jgi:hypothetical protein
MTNNTNTKYEMAVHTPQETADYGLKAIRAMNGKKSRGAILNIPEIRDYFAPVLPGQVCAIIAQTSNYKSGTMHFWERGLAEQLVAEDRLDEAIIHVSVEECVEEQSYLYLARETGEDPGDLARGNVQDWGKLEQAAVRVGNIPIYRIGDSLARADDMPELYLSNMIRSIKTLVDGKVTNKPVKPAALFFDYLQAFPFDPEMKRANPVDQRRLQVREDIYRLRQAATYFDCPVMVGVQAKQHLDGAPSESFQLPGIYDGEESSAIAQRVDRVITLWMPKQTHPVGTTIKHGEFEFKVTENLIFIKAAKQRGGLPSGKIWMCAIDFKKNNIAPVKLPARP